MSPGCSPNKPQRLINLSLFQVFVSEILVYNVCMCVYESESHSVMSNSLPPHGLYSQWNSPGQNTGVGSLSLLQENLSKPEIEPRSPALQMDSLPTELSRKPCELLIKSGKYITDHNKDN